MSSKRLYLEDQYLNSNSATVLDIANVDGFDSIVCSESCFFPEGGGQPSDVGTVSRGEELYNVIKTSDSDLESDVWHLTDAPAGTFHIGDEVVLAIDWDKRFCNMQRHLGEHMLSGTMHSLFGGVNRGFHMGESYITIDIDIDGRMLTDEEIDLAERTVNDAIWADLPVSIDYFENYEASKIMPVRKDVPHDGTVSIVTVGDPSDPYDCIACCGTHPSSSGQVGLVAIYKHEPNKGMNRIYFDCGIMAKEKLAADYRLLTDIANRNSCSTEDLLHKLDAADSETADMKALISKMSSYIKENEKAAILSSFTGKFLAYSLDLIPVEDLLKLGFAVIQEADNKVLALLHNATRTLLLFSSSDVKCGAVIKEHAPTYNGRGGGRDDNARAVFQDEKSMQAFADALSEMV